MDDQTILDRISALVDEERRLRDNAMAPESTPDRLKQVAEQLDQCWDGTSCASAAPAASSARIPTARRRATSGRSRTTSVERASARPAPEAWTAPQAWRFTKST
jgi:hypothetical protein